MHVMQKPSQTCISQMAAEWATRSTGLGLGESAIPHMQINGQAQCRKGREPASARGIPFPEAAGESPPSTSQRLRCHPYNKYDEDQDQSAWLKVRANSVEE
ncbi:hypothetical protein CIB48_g3918 [Xylaria polymorpha]|nr:hypothetical protein CIB48_g3918 [Xylaria polymorpha]